MKRTYRYRLLGNKVTFNKAESWLLLCQKLYNAALEQRIVYYRECKKTISCYSQINQLPEVRAEFYEYQDINAQILQDVIQRLDKAYKAFFRRVQSGIRKAGLPRFKSRDRYNSFTLKQSGWKLDGKYLTVRHVGRFKIRLSRPIEGVIKTVIIHRHVNGHWYVCFSCDKVPEHKLEPSVRKVGIDVGVKSFSVDSDGHKEFNPAYFRHTEKQLRVRQRVLSRRVKGSQGREEARLLVAKTHDKIANQRDAFLHRVANHYITNYGVIYIEDLNIKGMSKNHHLSKSISDAGWGRLFEILEYKAEGAGRQLVKVPRFEPTSKTCSVCNVINQDLTLNDREWVCKSCGTLHDRDYNAAKNILRAGQALQELTYGSTQSVS
jgi:putative transposase